ncbi:MAG: GTPase domain-containing protein [Gemmatimonadota bacterium]|jgi:signal recognition particle receptor subunit beta|nr:GTPase domain-containing protein [Gemmatimonadota bacterium]
MPIVNYAAREVTAKIVYYGPARSGKTTNLQSTHAAVPDNRKGEIVSLATEGDRTLFFDYLPIDLGRISGYHVRIQLYTVPGQVYYDSTRKLVLQGADGVVFVADSRAQQRMENIECFRNLQRNLLDQRIDPRTLPLVFQYNKRDLPDVMSVAELNRALNYRALPVIEATATDGMGVFETLQSITALVLTRLASRLNAVAEPLAEPGPGS